MMLHCLAPKEQPIRSGREGMLHITLHNKERRGSVR